MSKDLKDIDPELLGEARRKREEQVAAAQHVLDVCRCAWPLTLYRNGSGHHHECPRHVEIEEAAALRRRRRG